MWIVGGGDEGGKPWTVFLRAAEDRTTVDLRLRQGLFQMGVLTGTDCLQLVEVHQQVVGQCHLLVELVREVQVVEEVLSQMGWEQSGDEGCLTSSLCSY